MISLVALILCFVILVVSFTAAALCLSARAELLKRRFNGAGRNDAAAKRRLDLQTDRLKDLAFNATLLLSLFVLTPFVLMLWLL